MGYILPITHFDYKQYQNRMKETKESPHYVSSTYKVVFHQISSEYDEAGGQVFEQYEIPQEMKEDEPNPVSDLKMYHISNQQKAELTGKGGHINAQI